MMLAGQIPLHAPALPNLRRLGSILLPVTALLLVALVCVALVWAGAVHVFAIPDYLLPSPEKVVVRIARDHGLFWKHSLATLSVIVIGFGIR